MSERTRRLKVSLFGMIALAAGVIAWATVRKPLLQAGPVTLGAAGCAVAALALLKSIVLGSTGSRLPLVALLVCASAMIFGVYANGHMNEYSPKLNEVLNTYVPHELAKRPGVAPTPGPASAPTTRPAGGVLPDGFGSIFDMTSKPDAGTTRTHDADSSRITAGQTSPPTPQTTNGSITVQQAKAQLTSARKALIPALSTRPEYQSALHELTLADADLKDARASNDPGSPRLVAASHRWITARAAVQKIVDDAAAADPTCVAAEQQLLEAQATAQRDPRPPPPRPRPPLRKPFRLPTEDCMPGSRSLSDEGAADKLRGASLQKLCRALRGGTSGDGGCGCEPNVCATVRATVARWFEAEQAAAREVASVWGRGSMGPGLFERVAALFREAVANHRLIRTGGRLIAATGRSSERVKMVSCFTRRHSFTVCCRFFWDGVALSEKSVFPTMYNILNHWHVGSAWDRAKGVARLNFGVFGAALANDAGEVCAGVVEVAGGALIETRRLGLSRL